MVPINTGIFLCGLELHYEKAELSKYSWYPKRNLGVTMHLSEIINLQFGKKKRPYIALYFTFFLFRIILLYSCLITSEKCMVTPNFLF